MKIAQKGRTWSRYSVIRALAPLPSDFPGFALVKAQSSFSGWLPSWQQYLPQHFQLLYLHATLIIRRRSGLQPSQKKNVFWVPVQVPCSPLIQSPWPRGTDHIVSAWVVCSIPVPTQPQSRHGVTAQKPVRSSLAIRVWEPKSILIDLMAVFHWIQLRLLALTVRVLRAVRPQLF